MKIIRYFLHEEDEHSGMHGFMPLWIPRSAGFNVSGARGMIHDSLEHALSDTGKPHQEVIAFGRILALRVESGVNRGDTQESLGSELAELVSEAQDFTGDWDTTLPDPGPISVTDDQSQVRKLIRQVVDGMAARSGSKWFDGPPMGTLACTRAARLLGLGYLDAKRRYGGASGCNRLAWETFDWAENNTKTIDHLEQECKHGDVLRLTIDTHYGEVKTKVIHAGERLDWLRPRIHRWRTA